MEVFATSDLHLFHHNIIKYCNRPFASAEEMNEAIIRNWNSVVPVDGRVYVLGDFMLVRDYRNKVQQLRNVVSQLNGEKILVIGNHDYYDNQDYLDAGFSYVYDGFIGAYEHNVYFIMSHYQMTTWEDSHKGSMHLFGHEHWRQQHEPKHSIFEEMHWSERKFNVCVDANGFKPVNLKKIISILSRRPTNFQP